MKQGISWTDLEAHGYMRSTLGGKLLFSDLSSHFPVMMTHGLTKESIAKDRRLFETRYLTHTLSIGSAIKILKNDGLLTSQTNNLSASRIVTDSLWSNNKLTFLFDANDILPAIPFIHTTDYISERECTTSLPISLLMARSVVPTSFLIEIGNVISEADQFYTIEIDVNKLVENT